MRLLLVNYEYPPIGAGAANAIYHIARECKRAGHVVTVLTAGTGNLRGLADDEGVTVYRCLSARRFKEKSNIREMISFILWGIASLRKVIGNDRYDGCIAFFSFPGGPVALAAKWLYGIPYIVSLRGGDVPGTEPSLKLFYFLLKPLRRLILKNSKAVTANSIGLKEMSEKADPYPVEYIPNGVDTEFYSPRSGLKNDTVFSFLFVGRFREQKNIPFMFERLKELRSLSNKDFVLHMVGDGPLSGQLRRKADECGLSDIIRWHGWLEKDALRVVYRNSDCLLNFSIYEGMPNVVMEAMSCGLPAIVSDVPGNDLLVLNGDTGYICYLDDAGRFVEAMGELLRCSGVARMKGLKARERVKSHFSWNSAAKKYVEMFECEIFKV